MNVVELYKEDKAIEWALKTFRQFEQTFPAWKSEIKDIALLPLVDKLWAQMTAVCGTLAEAREMADQVLERMVEIDVAEAVERERKET